MLFANLFADHAVLDSSPARAARVWGVTSANDTISIALDGAVVATATADAASGRWHAQLPAASASARAYTLSAVALPSGRTQSLSDIVFGRTFVCAGQSNIDDPLLTHSENNEPSEWGASRSTTLRLMRVGFWHAAAAETDAAAIAPAHSLSRNTSRVLRYGENFFESLTGGSWRPATDDHALARFSATCYYFGQRLASRHPNVPIGLIEAAVGGTPIEAWLPPGMGEASCATNPHRMPTLSTWFDDRHVPSSGHYNGMIAPLVSSPGGPLRISGILWFRACTIWDRPNPCFSPALTRLAEPFRRGIP